MVAISLALAVSSSNMISGTDLSNLIGAAGNQCTVKEKISQGDLHLAPNLCFIQFRPLGLVVPMEVSIKELTPMR